MIASPDLRGSQAPPRPGPPRSRSSAHRLTVAGYVTLGLIVTTGVFTAGPQVDPRIVALVIVALIVLLVIGVVMPVATTRRVLPTASCPADVVVGDDAPVRIVLGGRADQVSVRLLGPKSAWFRTAVPASGTIEHRADRRGVYPYLPVEVSSSWPLGLYRSARLHIVVLERPVHVAPRPTAAQATPGPLPTEIAASISRSPVASDGDVVRAVRPYQDGDPQRLVHWPSSARTGSLVVRELDPPVRTGLVIAVDLRSDDPMAVEAAASRAAGLVASALRQGAEVRLATFEVDGPVLEPVTSTTQAGRRLAQAVAGEPPSPPGGWVVEWVRA